MSLSSAAEDALKRIIRYYRKFQGALVAATKDGK